MRRTLVEGWSKLESVDELRVEARSHLNAHAAQEEEDVHAPQVRLLVPCHLVLLDQAGDNGVRCCANVDFHHLDDCYLLRRLKT